MATNGTDTVVAGNLGHVLQSGDRSQWVDHKIPTLMGMIHADGQFLAVGIRGTVATSSDARKWELISLGRASLNSVAAGGGRFVAVGDEGATFSSGDARVWENHPAATVANLRGVTYGDGRFVAVGTAGTILYSADGRVWTAASSGLLWDVTGIATGPAGYVAVSNQGVILHSQDSARWEPVWKGKEAHAPLAVAFGSRKYVAVGRQVLISTDGRTWAKAEYPEKIDTLSAVTYGAGIFLAVGDRGKVVTSVDGLTWVDQKRFTTTLKIAEGDLAGIAFGKNLLVGGGHMVSLSPDGLTWTSIPNGPRLVAAVTVRDGQFVAVGRAGRIWTSADGIRWTDVGSPVADDLANVTWTGSGTFLTVGPWGTVLKGLVTRCGSQFSDVPGQHEACQAVELLAGLWRTHSVQTNP